MISLIPAVAKTGHSIVMPEGPRMARPLPQFIALVEMVVWQVVQRRMV